MGIPPNRSEALDYDATAERLLTRAPGAFEGRCNALFVYEAQDFGPHTLQLLSSLVAPSEPGTDHRSVMIFYDNTQNVYGRGTPK